MSRQIVFVHGRAQEQKDAAALKAEWIRALRTGLSQCGLALPISEDQIRFPYYGQTLYDLVSGVPNEQAAQVIVKGDNADADERAFMRAVLQEVKQVAGIHDAQLAAVGGQGVVAKGLLNVEWMQSIIMALDQYVPFASGASIALATNDVYQYLNNPGIRDDIEGGVRKAIAADVPTVVVSHSLGTVAAYNLLRREGQAQRWQVPLFITLGSPLAVTAIRNRLAPNKHPACVSHWFNAMDERDVVALYPLDGEHFPVKPAIENKRDVDNTTENRHGISGYLTDPTVARRIYEAVVG